MWLIWLNAWLNKPPTRDPDASTLNVEASARPPAVHRSGLDPAAVGRAAVSAQHPQIHYQYRIEMPPGEIGRRQLQRAWSPAGYFQPVEILR